MILSPLPSCREDDLAFAFLPWSYLAWCGAIRLRMAQDAETRTTIDELPESEDASGRRQPFALLARLRNEHKHTRDARKKEQTCRG